MILEDDFIELFDMFKKKASVVQPKTYIRARYKKEITDSESKWIGNHRFCIDCAAPLNSSVVFKQQNEKYKRCARCKRLLLRNLSN